MRILFLLLVLLINVFALSQQQMNLLVTVYNEAKKYKAVDGHVFNDTVCAIYLTESSAGIDVIGDNVDLKTGKLRTLFESSIGPGQIRLETALFVMNKFPKYFLNKKHLIHNDISAYKKYVVYLKNIDKFKNIVKNYKRRYQKTKSTELKAHYKSVLKWATRELRYNKKKIKKYKNTIYKDTQIINLLFTDLKFSVKISTLYLIYNYNYAIKNNMSNPWFRAISRYNGGWSNKTYYRKVLSKMRILRKLKQKGIIH